MKRIGLIPAIFLLFSFSSAAWGDLNPFEQREIVIEALENKSEKEYDYFGEAIANSIYDYALSIPFIILTDDERTALKSLSLLDEYSKQFEDAGGTVRYRLVPIVLRGFETVSPDYAQYDETSVAIYGFYEIESDETVTLSIRAHSNLTGKDYAEYQRVTTLKSAVKNPESYLTDFFKLLLRYKTHTVTFSTQPRDALVFVDDILITAGESKQILLEPGAHRITVKKKGYRTFSDLIQVREDGLSRHVILEEEKKKAPVEYAVTPKGTRIYTGERYEGESPLSFGLSSEERTVTFVKEGYVRLTVPAEEIEGLRRYEVSLIAPEIRDKVQRQAELHKKGSETLYYTGLGMVGVSMLLGIEKTAYQQKADLYNISGDTDRYNEAIGIANTLTYLTAASAVVTTGIFIFSFIEMLKYFDLYNDAKLHLLKGEVRF